MSSVSLEEKENFEYFPDFDLVRQKFFLTLPENNNNAEAKNKLLDVIKSRNMAPWYETICTSLGWTYDEKLHAQMKNNNDDVLRVLNEGIKDAQTHGSATEVRHAYLTKSNYLISIGDKDNALKILSLTFAITVAVGYQLDNVMTCARIGFFFMDHDLIVRSLARADYLIKLKVDYDRKNRLDIYKGFYGLIVRDFSTSTAMFLKSVPTFACRELMDYSTFIRDTLFAAVLTLTRSELKDHIINCSDILQVLHEDPKTKDYVFSLYECEYDAFFKNLAEIEQVFRKNYYLNPHYQFYVREMKIKAYLQFMISYKSLNITYMAQQFGVTPEFIESEISQLISCGKIYGQIDKVNGIISVTRGVKERRNEMFKK